MSKIKTDTAVEMIQSAAIQLATASAELSGLDAVAGDGDHGVNIASAFADADSRIAARQPQSAAEVFHLVAHAFNEGSGGASGALFGAFFIALGDSLSSPDGADMTEFVNGLGIASHRVSELGRARPGDKTMLDALGPAIDASRSMLNEEPGAAAVLAAAAAGAQRGAEATATMQASAGRARYASRGAIGTRDPGAVSVAVMFRAWADAVASRPDSQPKARPHEGHPESTTPKVDRPVSASDTLNRGTPPDERSGLEKFATTSGHLAILALDHVRSFATTMRPSDPDSITLSEIIAAKQELVANLAPNATAVLVDPGLASTSTRSTASTAAIGLIIGIEDADYDEAATSPRLLSGWTAERAARVGADAVKISVYFDPDEDTSAAERFVAETVHQCDLVDLPLFCEPLPQIGDPRDTRRKVLEGVRRFGSLGAAVMKIQFPHDTVGTQSREAWAEACEEADTLSPAPWALLSQGRHFQEFRELLTIACRAGASGFVAGRVIWGVAGTGRDPHAVSTQRLNELRSIAISEGSPWNQRRSPSTPSNPGVEL